MPKVGVILSQPCRAWPVKLEILCMASAKRVSNPLSESRGERRGGKGDDSGRREGRKIRTGQNISNKEEKFKTGEKEGETGERGKRWTRGGERGREEEEENRGREEER